MKKPNIIFILADDMGYGDVSCQNENSAFWTPNFDRIGKEGIKFTDAHASSAVCTPSRYSILTGRYNWRSNLKAGVLFGFSPALIEENRQTLAGMLRENGYKTACVGKWHLGMDWEKDENDSVNYSAKIKNAPITRGFDYFYGISASLDMPPYVYIENDHVTKIPDTHYAGISPLEQAYAREGDIADDFRHIEVLPKLTAKVLEKIEEYKANPFFIYFPLNAPHTPILPTEKFIGKSGTNAYGDFCLMCDDAVGQVLDKLDELKIAGNTIVVYTSDNGCSPFANFDELSSFGHNPNYIFRGHKADIYEGGHRVPLLLRWPDITASGSVCNDTVCLCDFFATVADILQVSLSDDTAEDSISLLPVLKNESYDKPLRDYVIHQSIDGSLSIRKGRFKLEMCPGSGGWSYPRPGEETNDMPSIQLYDLDSDIGEKINIYDKYPEIVTDLKKELFDCVMNGRSTPGQKQKNNGAEIWETVSWLADIEL